MTGPVSLRILIFLAILMMTAGTVSAAWIEDGAVISSYSGNQTSPKSIPDGSGGAIVIWQDTRGGYTDIYAQRVDAYGNVLWTDGGVLICTGTAPQWIGGIVSDGSGGAIICWDETRVVNWDIYAQRIDANGSAVWTANGVAVCSESGDQEFPKIVADDLGGAIIAWQDRRSGSYDIYAQRINGSGTLLWDPSGEPACTATADQYSLEIITDGDHGAIIAWEDLRNGNLDIYAQRLNYTNGNYWWPADGVAVCDNTATQRRPVMIPGTGGGATIAWEDTRGGTYDIYVQRIYAGGSSIFTANGIAVCIETGSQYFPKIAPDGAGGAYIAWRDGRNSGSTGYDIYAARLDLAGNPYWTANGIPVCNEYFTQQNLNIASDGEGGFIATWEDYRFGDCKIAAQKIDENGYDIWEENGVILCLSPQLKTDPVIVPDGDGGAIVAWEDTRGDIGYDVYAQRVERNGYWGYPAPGIVSVRDVPGDQGGFINLAWDASRLDPFPEDRISYYYIWRAIDEMAALAFSSSGPPMLTSSEGLASDIPRGSIRMEMLAEGPFYWELIGSVNAYNLENYSKILETSFDSTAECAEYHYFQVSAHYSSSAFWFSQPDSGRSVDNLAPEAPLGLSGEQQYSPEGLRLTWDPNSESDLAGYNIYRGTSGGFEPGPGNFVSSTPDTFTLDGDWSWEAGYWYKVAAVDIHGNESPFSVFEPDAVTGDEPMPLPDATFLSQNFPNPFNPSTTIEFGLKKNGNVSLRIYDAAGRLVVSLVDGSRPAGRYTETWNGNDLGGNRAASGVYFYMLKTEGFEETKKMILLR